MPKFDVNGIEFVSSKYGLSTCLVPVLMDIETANNHAEDVKDLITWMTSCQVWFNGEYHLFRKPMEVVEWLCGIYEKYDLRPRAMTTSDGKRVLLLRRMIVYIHNSSYDLSYLIPYFERYLPGWTKKGQKKNQGIITKENRFITYVRGAFEFRCSYHLSGMSLEKWSEEMNIEHKKLVGFYDYNKVIYQDSELESNEQDYDMIDVLAMQECIDRQLALYGDDLSTVPYTKTGYVRRELRNACKKSKTYRNKYFKKNSLDVELYRVMRNAYAGGYTHNNRFLTDKLVNAAIGHRDFKSHYPSQMRVNMYPLGPFEKIYYAGCPDSIGIEDILKKSPKYSTMTVMRCYMAKLKDRNCTMPYLAEAKCYGHLDNSLPDNGRLIYADSKEGFILYLTDYDLKMLDKLYYLDYEILVVWQSRNEYLPECITSVIDKYFKGKSDKKAVVHELTELYGKLDPRTVDAQMELQVCKAMLNAIYGCCATNPLRDQWSFNSNFEFRLDASYSTDEEIEEGLFEYYNKRNNFLPYQVGVWVTAQARYELFEYAEAIGYDKVLYCDTDSIFYRKDDATEQAISDLNKAKREHAEAVGAYVVLDNGKKEYYDVFDDEPDGKAFKGLHAKCYGMVTDKGLELTIAGVPARTLIRMDGTKPVYLTREEELAGDETDPVKALDKLTFGTTFTVNTGKTAVYVGATGANSYREPTTVMVDGHLIETAGGCVIRTTPSKKIKDFIFDSEYEEDIFGLQN